MLIVVMGTSGGYFSAMCWVCLNTVFPTPFVDLILLTYSDAKVFILLNPVNFFKHICYKNHLTFVFVLLIIEKFLIVLTGVYICIVHFSMLFDLHVPEVLISMFSLYDYARDPSVNLDVSVYDSSIVNTAPIFTNSQLKDRQSCQCKCQQ